MKVLTYARANELDALHTELLAAVPALRQTTVIRVDGRDLPLAGHQLLANGDTITLSCADDVDEAAVAAVVAAHDAAAARAAKTAEASVVAADRDRAASAAPPPGIVTKLRNDAVLSAGELQGLVRWLALREIRRAAP